MATAATQRLQPGLQLWSAEKDDAVQVLPVDTGHPQVGLMMKGEVPTESLSRPGLEPVAVSKAVNRKGADKRL
jgi:hypothetical protein